MKTNNRFFVFSLYLILSIMVCPLNGPAEKEIIDWCDLSAFRRPATIGRDLEKAAEFTAENRVNNNKP